jgi:hypothetical protein
MDELFVLMSERGSLGSVQEQSIEMSGVQDPLPLPILRFHAQSYDFPRSGARDVAPRRPRSAAGRFTGNIIPTKYGFGSLTRRT